MNVTGTEVLPKPVVCYQPGCTRLSGWFLSSRLKASATGTTLVWCASIVWLQSEVNDVAFCTDWTYCIRYQTSCEAVSCSSPGDMIINRVLYCCWCEWLDDWLELLQVIIITLALCRPFTPAAVHHMWHVVVLSWLCLVLFWLQEMTSSKDGCRERLTSAEFINLFKEVATRPEIYFLLMRFVLFYCWKLFWRIIAFLVIMLFNV